MWGDLGPCGDFLEPLGTVRSPAGRRVCPQAEDFCQAASWFHHRTTTAIEEVLMAKPRCGATTELPIFASLV